MLQRSGVRSWAGILGRAAIHRNPAFIPRAAGRCVLVTGAGGFIGAAMVRVLAASGAERLVLLESAEQPLAALFREMAADGWGDRSVPILGSVCDRTLLSELFEAHRPDLVLHAAALKDVPLMERNPFAAVATNALGTRRLAQAAATSGVEEMILVSTDKAVAPHSIMGASKRIAELAMLDYPEWGAAVRLVNVMGSPGSVAPLFAEQIAGGPVTVTHRQARRYFLTLQEVTALLAEAMEANSRGLLIPDPGGPLLIQELARRMIAASGRTVTIVFTGPRPGDKLDEALVARDERCEGSATPGLRQVHSSGSADWEAAMRALEVAVSARDLPGLLHAISSLVPDYQPSVVLRDAAGVLAGATV